MPYLRLSTGLCFALIATACADRDDHPMNPDTYLPDEHRAMLHDRPALHVESAPLTIDVSGTWSPISGEKFHLRYENISQTSRRVNFFFLGLRRANEVGNLRTIVRAASDGSCDERKDRIYVLGKTDLPVVTIAQNISVEFCAYFDPFNVNRLAKSGDRMALTFPGSVFDRDAIFKLED